MTKYNFLHAATEADAMTVIAASDLNRPACVTTRSGDDSAGHCIYKRVVRSSTEPPGVCSSRHKIQAKVKAGLERLSTMRAPPAAYPVPVLRNSIRSFLRTLVPADTRVRI